MPADHRQPRKPTLHTAIPAPRCAAGAVLAATLAVPLAAAVAPVHAGECAPGKAGRHPLAGTRHGCRSETGRPVELTISGILNGRKAAPKPVM